MFKIILTVFLLFSAALSEVVAQKSLNLSFGFPEINLDYEGNFDGLRTVYRNGWSITLSGYKIRQNGVIYGFDVGVNRYGNGFQYDRMRFDIKEIHHFSVLPFIGYNHSIREAKFSIRANLGFGLGIVPIENKTYLNDKSFQTGYTSYGVPLYDLTFSGSQEVKSRIFPLLKPSLELHYAVGERSTLFLKGTLGISLMNSVIVRDFPEVLLDGENYSVTHSTSLSYSSLEIGYSYRIK
ncbi:hypothetical protein SAMN03080617_03439 [Algoriphagus alkaliphilus]|uniref:Outer membrane protein beta-barrel domain-containing protein n=1 Tax=Algoriphagus alkaliphilus TaxID=279824 RepID=A0A1G5ZAU1_9BACT|nr:hypothetical protein [Algoriphagus alkaliphilus]SDA91752.1 hypothetical protein SAMN03080617_03439 [Algoriphagus alkaliphilus]